jgi:hypothetical protein
VEQRRQTRKVRANWRFPHNLWSAGERDKGEYQGSMLLELPRKSRASAELKIRIVNSDGIDRLWVDFVDEETKKTIVTLSKGFYSKTPQTPVTVTSDKGGYSTGEHLLGAARFGNPFGAKSTGSVQFVLTDSSGRTAATTDVPFEAEADGAVVSCDIPLGDLFSGSCVLQAFVTLRGAMSGVGELPFTYKGVRPPFRGKILDRFTGAPVANARISFYLGADRTDAVSDANGILSLSLPAAVYAIAAEADGYNAFTRTMAIRPASGDAKTDSDAFMLRLLPFGKGAGTGMVHGTIFDRVTNEVVPDMAIQFVRGTEILEIRSDATGRTLSRWSPATTPPGASRTESASATSRCAFSKAGTRRSISTRPAARSRSGCSTRSRENRSGGPPSRSGSAQASRSGRRTPPRTSTGTTSSGRAPEGGRSAPRSTGITRSKRRRMSANGPRSARSSSGP